MAPLWKRLDAGLPIVTTEKNLYIQLEPSRPGVLRIRCSRGSFPQGALSLIVSNWPQTVHWCVPARLEGEVLTADMAGSEAAFDPEDNRPLCLALAQETERGLVLYPLRALRLLQRMKTAARSLYLYDNRDENFGNARDVRNLFEVLVSIQSDRVAQLENPTRDDLVYITVADFEQAERNENGDEEKGENESHIELKLESSEEASAEAPENEPEEDAETTSDPEPASEQ